MAYEQLDQYASPEATSEGQEGGAAAGEAGLDPGLSHQIAAASGPGDLGDMLSQLPEGMHDQAVQFAHKTHGNSFVHRALQLRGGGAGGEGAMHQVALAGVSSGGGELPHRETIQRSFGAEHDLAGVQAHVGGTAAAASTAMSADAYTVGNHVAFGGSPSLHLAAHEAAHVVQQRGGVQLKGGVGEVGDAYERHADQVADAVVQGESASGLLAQQPGGGGGEAVQRHALDVSGGDLDQVKTRAGDDNLQVLTTDVHRPTRTTEQGVAVKDGKSMAKNPAFEAKAQAFEDRFAAKVWADGRTKATTQQMSKVAKTFLTAKYGEWKTANDRLMGVLAKIGGDTPAWSGSVGKTSQYYQALLDVFDQGNVAEQMCHLENFYTSVMGQAALEPDTASVDKLVEEAEMDPVLWEERRKAVAASGNEFAMISTPGGSDVEGQWHTRMKRHQNSTPEERAEGERSRRTIEETGAELSPREEALHKEKNPAFDKTKDPVMWAEGVRIWIMNEQDKWVFAQRQSSLPLGAGPSGTTNKCMQVARLLGIDDAYMARLACIGYLLQAHHHTLVEILCGAEPHGAAFTRGQGMYRNLQPYAAEELASSCGEGGKFPDELEGDHLSLS